jgi:hypothetical protein
MSPSPIERAPVQGVREAPVDRAASFHRRVEALCLARLREALDRDAQVFDRQLRQGLWDRTRGTEDLTGTAICLVGLGRAGVDPRAIGLEPHHALAALLARWGPRRYPGALGLLVWANAVWDGLPLGRLLEALDVPQGRLGEAGVPLTTMEAAWLVSGLVHEVRRSGHPWTKVALEAALADLLARQHPGTQLFEHAGDAAPVQHRLRRHVANFADQIYAVQAAALAATLAPDAEPLAAAAGCAARLVSLQGDLGQWWWHYDPRAGMVVQPFPVYAVHQHAMAPMALDALAAAGGPDHRAARDRGYAWLDGNELGVSLVDLSAGTIWRSVERREPSVTRLARNACAVAGLRASPEAPPPALAVNRETRPYEWGWCLYAGAAADAPEREGDAA